MRVHEKSVWLVSLARFGSFSIIKTQWRLFVVRSSRWLIKTSSAVQQAKNEFFRHHHIYCSFGFRDVLQNVRRYPSVYRLLEYIIAIEICVHNAKHSSIKWLVNFQGIRTNSFDALNNLTDCLASSLAASRVMLLITFSTPGRSNDLCFLFLPLCARGRLLVHCSDEKRWLFVRFHSFCLSPRPHQFVISFLTLNTTFNTVNKENPHIQLARIQEVHCVARKNGSKSNAHKVLTESVFNWNALWMNYTDRVNNKNTAMTVDTCRLLIDLYCAKYHCQFGRRWEKSYCV